MHVMDSVSMVLKCFLAGRQRTLAIHMLLAEWEGERNSVFHSMGGWSIPGSILLLGGETRCEAVKVCCGRGGWA